MIIEQSSRNLHRAEIVRDQAELLPAKAQPSPRRYELDWLRIIIVLGAIVFHAVYELQVYYPQAHSALLTTLTGLGSTFALQWGLPVLFLIAGASAWLSLAHRSGQQFFKERVLHLLVPFIGCVLTVIPVSIYMASLISSGPHPHIPFLQFSADYFQSYAQFFQGDPLDHFIALWGVLWFIFVIFVLSLLTLPLILLLRRPRGMRVVAGFAMVCRVPGGTLIAGLLFVLCSWFVGAVVPTTGVSTLWLAALCTLSYIAGVLLYADPAIERAIARDGPAALVLATLCFATEQVLATHNALPLPHSGGYVLSALLAGGFPWFGAIAFLGLAKRLFRFTNRALEYLKEAVFPYFLLHMLVLALFGYIFLVHSRLPGVVQCLAILICWILALTLLYEVLIKRLPLLRFIFGLKSRPRT